MESTNKVKVQGPPINVQTNISGVIEKGENSKKSV